jgi:broad specificity phosphatase PhoE
MSGSASKGLFIVRHPESVFNAQNTWAGCLDSHLSNNGLASLPFASNFWSNYNLESVASSNLTRCKVPAEFIAVSLSLNLLPPNPNLNERCAGSWEGMLLSEVVKDPVFTQWSTFERVTPPNGEAFGNFNKRVMAGIFQLLKHDSLTLVVSHTGVLNMLCSLYALPKAHFAPLVEGLFIEYSQNSDKTLQVSFFS